MTTMPSETLNDPLSPAPINPEQLEALQELLNIGMGRAAGSLHHMLEKPIHFHIPFLQLRKMEMLSQEWSTSSKTIWSSVQLRFKGTITGSACLLIPTEDIEELGIALSHERRDTHTWDALAHTTFTEVGNIVLNDVMSSLASILQFQITHSSPHDQESSFQELFQTRPVDSSQIVLWTEMNWTIADYHITGNMMLFLGMPALELLIKAINEMTHSMATTHG